MHESRTILHESYHVLLSGGSQSNSIKKSIKGRMFGLLNKKAETKVSARKSSSRNESTRDLRSAFLHDES